MDPEGYPDEEELKCIREWPKDWEALMEYVKRRWWMPDWGWTEARKKTYVISTGGWSGNEDLIGAMHDNWIFWSMCWEQSRRGGHYIFKLPEREI